MVGYAVRVGDEKRAGRLDRRGGFSVEFWVGGILRLGRRRGGRIRSAQGGDGGAKTCRQSDRGY
jgi:hypothetical protein